MNKKILLSFLLVVLVALSVASVSAEETTDIVAVDDSSVDEVVAVDEVDDVLAETYQPEEATVDAVQTAVDSAKNAGDIVDLSKHAEYDFTNKTIKVTGSNIIIKGDGTTTIKGHGANDGLFYITGNNVTLQGLVFINTNPKNDIRYNGTIEGWAVKIQGVNGATVKDSSFNDFNTDIRVQASEDVLIENNKFLGGISLGIINDPTVNKETGTKSLNIMSSSKIVIKDNTFDGPVLDAISIAGGSGFNKVINNTIKDAAYAIYFGGASTKGSLISENKFINSGSFKENDILYEQLPVISIQKSSNDIVISKNIFEAINNNVLVAAEQGNEAHGAPTDLGNISVIDNTVKKYTNDVDASTVTLFRVLIRERGTLDLNYGPLNITGNTLDDGVKGISVILKGEDADTEIFTAKETILTSTVSPVNENYLFNTSLSGSDITLTAGDSGNVEFTLKDNNGNVLVNKALQINVNGEIKEVKTDSDGVAKVPVSFATANTYFITAVFLGEGNNYKSSIASAKVTVNAKASTPTTPATVTKKATTLTAKKATLKVKKVKKISVTLKSSGKAVAGKKITIKVNKKTFSAKTNKKGVATIKVKVTKKGTFTATVKFAGDSTYKAVTKSVKYTVKK